MTNGKNVSFQERPYRPSSIDRFTNWVDTLSMRAWIFYVVIGFAVILIQMLALWVVGGLQAEELLPVISFNGLAIPYLLALIHLLDNQAVTALDSMRPTLELTEPEVEQYKYMLSNMPSRPALISGLIVVAIAILSERLLIAPTRFAVLEQLPIFSILFHIIDKSSAFLFGPFIYHTIKQLRLVNTINLNHVRINLFDLGPLQAFSRLTASTAVGLVVYIYVWMLINPDLLKDPIIIGIGGLITVFAIGVFVWPLFGVHRLMVMEKERALHEIDRRFEAAFSKFNQRFLDDDYPAIEGLNATIASLEIQHKRVDDIPTWPWRPETARFALTAIAFPLVLMILQFFVPQIFDR